MKRLISALCILVALCGLSLPAQAASSADYTSGALFKLWNQTVPADRKASFEYALGHPVDPVVDSLDGVAIGEHACWFMAISEDNPEYTTDNLLLSIWNSLGDYGYDDVDGVLTEVIPLLSGQHTTTLLESDLYYWDYIYEGWDDESPFNTDFEFYRISVESPDQKYVFLLKLFGQTEDGESCDLLML